MLSAQNGAVHVRIPFLIAKKFKLFAQVQAGLRSRRDGVLLGAKSTKSAGVPIPPHPRNGLAGA